MKEIVALPVDEAVARICRDHLKAARHALPRVQNHEDSEGLHDFRVALCRIRNYLHSYRGILHGAIPEKSYRQLKKLASRTNQARDAEEMLVWLDSEVAQLTPRQRVGAEWWRKRLNEQCMQLHSKLEEELDEEFNALAESLDKKLKKLIKQPIAKRSFGRSTASQVRQRASELTLELSEIHSISDTTPISQVLNTGKKLRYLLEPPGKTILVCRHAAKSMELFQELFGTLNACFVRHDVMRKIIAEAATEWAAQQLQKTLENGQVTIAASEIMPGLLAIARRNHSVEAIYYQQIERDYLHGRSERLIKHLDGVVELLKS